MFLECTNLGFRYPNTDSDVFREISLQFETPGFHALFGPSGVGKTSFARIIAGEIKGYTGQLHVKEKSILLYSYNQERLPGWSTIDHFLQRITPSSRVVMKDRLIDTFGLTECMSLKYSQLSLGQQNRINLLRYLLQDFDLLIMDESLANVDERSRETIILEIKALFPEQYFLYISHNLMEVSKFCDSILVFRDAQKDPQALFLNGLNIRKDETPNKDSLEFTLLEIMNAC